MTHYITYKNNGEERTVWTSEIADLIQYLETIKTEASLELVSIETHEC